MKLYECSNGVLINPCNVTHCQILLSEGRHHVRFYFNSGSSINIAYNREIQAVNEMLRYKQHCDEMSSNGE